MNVFARDLATFTMEETLRVNVLLPSGRSEILEVPKVSTIGDLRPRYLWAGDSCGLSLQKDVC